MENSHPVARLSIHRSFGAGRSSVYRLDSLRKILPLRLVAGFAYACWSISTGNPQFTPITDRYHRRFGDVIDHQPRGPRFIILTPKGSRRVEASRSIAWPRSALVNSIYNRRIRGLNRKHHSSTRSLSGPQIAFPVSAHTVAIFSDIMAERSQRGPDRAGYRKHNLVHSKARLLHRPDRSQVIGLRLLETEGRVQSYLFTESRR
jgi:hypothetical protein